MIVDNCSPNESAEVFESKSQEMDFIFYENKTNAGYAAGNNIGISMILSITMTTHVFSTIMSNCGKKMCCLTWWKYRKKIRQKYIQKSREVYRVYGCCMLLKNSVMKDVDCIDERTFLYRVSPFSCYRALAMPCQAEFDYVFVITRGLQWFC